jgi:hypothetical protein
MTTPSFDVFLSYSRGDELFVARLKSALEAHGLTVWRDREEIRAGDLIVKALERGLAASRAVAFVVSPASLRSGWVEEEYARALGLIHSAKPMRLVPLLLEDAELPGFLQNRSHVDFREEENFEQSVQALVWGIRADDDRGSRPSKRVALLDRRLVGELLVSYPLGERTRRVGSRSLLANLYALAAFERVLVENHFGSVLQMLLLRDDGPLRDILLALPAEPFPAVSAGSIATSWATEPSFQIAAARYARTKGSSSESIQQTGAYLEAALGLARRFDATIVAHPDRLSLFTHWCDNNREAVSRGTRSRLDLTLPSPVGCMISADRARRLGSLVEAWSPSGLRGRLVQYPPMSPPTPPSAPPASTAPKFAYEFLSVEDELA